MSYEVTPERGHQMSTWTCESGHPWKVGDQNTIWLRWEAAGRRPDGRTRWVAHCRACEELRCPSGHTGGDLVMLATPSGEWWPACVRCLLLPCPADAMRQRPEGAPDQPARPAERPVEP